MSMTLGEWLSEAILPVSTAQCLCLVMHDRNGWFSSSVLVCRSPPTTSRDSRRLSLRDGHQKCSESQRHREKRCDATGDVVRVKASVNT